MNVGRRTFLELGGLALAGVAWPRGAAAQGAFETPPVLRAADLVPAELLSGPGFKVDDLVPIKGLLGYFSLKADVGSFEVHGADLLRVRVAELHALRKLDETSKTETFAKAAAGAAARPVQAAASIVTSPVETAKGIPDGVGRFFDRVKLGAKSVAASASESDKSDTERAADVTQRVGSISADALGYEKERRDLAKSVQVDPYTTNPVLSKKLSDMAWVAFSGRVGVNLLVSVFVPGSTLLSAVSVTESWVWDTPPGDLIKQAQEKLAATGAPEAQVTALIKNHWYSLSVLTVLANSIAQLAPAKGLADVVALAATASNEDHARFFALAVKTLADRQQGGGDRVSSLTTRGTVEARTASGALVIPGPVDYIAWTKNAADFAARPDLKAPRRTLLLRGLASPRAKRELASLGWTVAERTPMV